MSRVSKSFRSWRPPLWQFFRQIILSTKMLEIVAVIWILQLWIYRGNWDSKTRTFSRVCASFLQVNYPSSAAASDGGSWRLESSLFRAITRDKISIFIDLQYLHLHRYLIASLQCIQKSFPRIHWSLMWEAMQNVLPSAFSSLCPLSNMVSDHSKVCPIFWLFF